MGGSNTVYGIVDNDGHILASAQFPTASQQSAEKFCEHLSECILSLIKQHNITLDQISGIGIGAPCANFNTGKIEGATNLPWPSPIPLKQLIEAHTSLSVSVTNDANAAAVGEMIYGVAKGMKNFVVITLGTGVGSGIVCDGRVLTGSRGFAGELGHCSVRRTSDRMCACGRKGCLQTYCSASGVCETAQRLLTNNANTPSVLRDIPKTKLTAKTIFQAAMQGDALARKTFRLTGEILGEACADFATFSDPEAFIIFGGVAKAGELITKPLQRELDKNLLHIYKNHVKILTSKFDDAQAAILGAAAMGRL